MAAVYQWDVSGLGASRDLGRMGLMLVIPQPLLVSTLSFYAVLQRGETLMR